MNSIISWNRGLQTAVLGAVVLLSACQSNALPPQTGSASQPNSAPAQKTFQRLHGAPIAESTPLPANFGLARSAGAFSPQAGKAYLYIADQTNNQIDIFPLNGKMQPQVGTITSGISGPYGLWFDRGAQELYVANQSNSTVTVYAHGSIQPSRTYSQDLSRPLYPIVDRQGELYVGNANTGTVVEYLAGSTNVFQVVQTAGAEVDGLALDKHENLYVAYRDSNGQGSIEVFAPGATQGKIIGMSLNQPQGVVVVPSGNVLGTETGGTNRIDVFPPGSPNAKLEVPMPAGVPTELAIDCNEAFLYVSAFDTGAVSGVDFPLPGQILFVKDQVTAIIQGVTIDNNQNP